MTVRKIIIEDNTKKLKNILRELNSKKIKIGIFGEDSSEILMIATVNEFGCNIKVTPKMRGFLAFQGLHLKKSTTHIRIPERSFMRKGIDSNSKKIQKFIDAKLDDLFQFRINTTTFFNAIGVYVVGLIQKYLTDLKTPPNHPFTLEKKKPRKNPLINTARLRNSITFKIEG